MDKGRANGEIRVNEVNLAVATAPGNSSGTGSTILRLDTATAVRLEKGDLVSIRAFHDAGVTKNLLSGRRETNLQIIHIPNIE